MEIITLFNSLRPEVLEAPEEVEAALEAQEGVLEGLGAPAQPAAQGERVQGPVGQDQALGALDQVLEERALGVQEERVLALVGQDQALEERVLEVRGERELALEEQERELVRGERLPAQIMPAAWAPIPAQAQAPDRTPAVAHPLMERLLNSDHK